MVLMISGGIGVTPMQSIAKDLFNESGSKRRDLVKKLHFVWALRSAEVLSAMKEGSDRSPEGTSIYNKLISSDAFDLSVYRTRKAADDETENMDYVKGCCMT